MKTIAVLLTVFNRKDKTLECLKHLYVQNGIGVHYDIEVYLTDDGCTDGTPEAVNSLFPYVHRQSQSHPSSAFPVLPAYLIM